MASGPGQPKPSLHLETLNPSIPIPTFLQNILSANPAPPTPSPANPNPPASSSASAALYTLPQAPPPPEDPLIPPENFSLVCSGVYRSGFPKKRNFEFMETLRLKTVLTLVLEDYPDSNLKWCEERDVQFMVGSPLCICTEATLMLMLSAAIRDPR
jgi:tyrosine-protein phosphatase SIW14